VELDETDLNTFEGGSSMNIGGALINSGDLTGLFIGSDYLSAPDEVTAASLDNSGVIDVAGSLYTANQALLDVTTGVAGFGTAGVLSGCVGVTGDAAIEFVSGQITSLAANASLELAGPNAFIEDSTALGSNSALTGLASIGSLAILELGGGASESTSGALVNNGDVILDQYLGGGTTLSIGGVLTNSGSLDIGNIRLSSPDSVTAKSFVNSGKVDLIGDGAGNLADLNVTGATTNGGSISITSDTEELAGAVRGAGRFRLSNANLLFDSSVSSGQTIRESGADGLTLKQAQKFAGTIRGFGTGDTIDAANFLLSGTTFNFVENPGGTLTLRDGGLTAHIHMTGVYSNSDFTLAPDSGTGTLVKFV
jgi:hypothetical protein